MGKVIRLVAEEAGRATQFVPRDPRSAHWFVLPMSNRCGPAACSTSGGRLAAQLKKQPSNDRPEMKRMTADGWRLNLAVAAACDRAVNGPESFRGRYKMKLADGEFQAFRLAESRILRHPPKRGVGLMTLNSQQSTLNYLSTTLVRQSAPFFRFFLLQPAGPQ